MQGKDTDLKAIQEIRDAIKSESETTVRILNYKKTGEPFWNMFTMAPMADADGNNRFFIGVQVSGDVATFLSSDLALACRRVCQIIELKLILPVPHMGFVVLSGGAVVVQMGIVGLKV